MRVLRSVVVSEPAWQVAIEQAQGLKRGRIGAQAVGGDCLRFNGLVAEQPPQQSERSVRVGLPRARISTSPNPVMTNSTE